ncbi:hypothetical protein SAMN05880501_103113 [Ureibacillus xyleni]|uniref:Uncharacterized protein n=1 Tax=Ureibacillus xyleni TaxID=614648 RepID=A0A285SB02_9BACL|nr:CopG family transcriptional regulator [Ureibacillus xyleni]SOC02824.1 hypothetical protein SAMN05880501_103113 [Ureibacillus xyleni]
MVHKEQTVGMYINLPKQLKDDFNQMLQKKGASMSAVIRLLITDYLTENGTPSKPKLIGKRINKKKGSA